MRPRATACCLLFLLVACASSAPAAMLAAGNAFVERAFGSNVAAPAFEIENRIARKRFAARGERFKLYLETNGAAHEVLASQCRLVSAKGDASSLTLRFREPKLGLTINVHYAAGAGDFFMHKWLEVSCDRGAPLLSWVVVDAIELDGLAPDYVGGRGKPAFVGPFFMGLEHPAGMAVKAGKGVELRHYPGKTLGKEPFRTQTAVLGCAASKQQLLSQFHRYVDRIRYDYPKPLRHHIVAKLYYVARRFNEQEYGDFVDQFRQHLYEPTGLSFDTLNVWNYYQHGPGIFIWDRNKFPNGFRPIVAKLKPMGARIGFWFSLFCHERCDTMWGYKRGWEVQGDPAGDWAASRYCLAGPRYNKACRKRLFELVNEYKPGFIHFDFNSFSCSTPGHGHLPSPNHGFEANVDAEIAILEDIRKVVPDIFLMMGCGSYSSPWWLQYYDVVFGMRSDSGLCNMPDPSPKSNEITKRDITFKQRFTQTDPTFPAWGYWTHEPLLNRGEFATRPVKRLKLDFLAKWEDNLVMDMHRGTRVWAMHFDPALLNAREGAWQFLAHAIRYARKHNAVTRNMKLVGGDPAKREPYGYAHWSDDGRLAIVAVRNPFITRQRMAIKLDESIGLAATEGKLSVRVVYPFRYDDAREYSFGDALPIDLERHELRVLHIAPRPRLEQPFLAGKRYSITDAGGKLSVWQETAPPAVVSLSDVRGKLDGLTIRGSAAVRVERGAAKLLLLHEIEPPFPKLPAFEVKVDGKPASGKRISYTQSAYRVKGVKPSFAWYIVPMDPGAHRVEFAATMVDRFYNARVSLHLAADVPMKRTALDARISREAFAAQLLAPHEWQGKTLRTVSSDVMTFAGSLPRVTATASSFSTARPMFVPQSAVDGTTATPWVSTGTRNEWGAVDLGEPAALVGVKVIWYSPWKVRNYKIQLWRGDAWVDQVARQDDNTGNDTKGSYEIVDRWAEPVTARKLRVLCVDVDPGSANTAIREIEVLRAK